MLPCSNSNLPAMKPAVALNSAFPLPSSFARASESTFPPLTIVLGRSPSFARLSTGVKAGRLPAPLPGPEDIMEGIPPASTSHPSGPAESLYLQLSSVGLDPGRVFKVRGASLDRSAIHITLEDGTIAFTKDVLGRITGAFFEGDGEVLLAPPNDVERRSMSLFTGMAILEEHFSTAYFRFNDNTATELQTGLRTPEQPEQFAARWDQTARNLAQVDAMRMLASFSEMLPIAGGTISNDPPAARTADPYDRMLHVRLQGNKLGIFDLFFDSTAGEQIDAAPPTTQRKCDRFLRVLTD